VLALSACSDSDSSNPASETPSAQTLSGTAAVGAAISGGTVSARCSDGSEFIEPVTTDENGSWSGSVNNGVLPCALQVSGGTPPAVLYSYASSAGTINITPLTSLALAQATNQLPADWFADFDGTVVDVSTSAEQLIEALENAGYSVPDSGNPFSTAFTADGSGWDGLLDELKQAIEDDPNLTALDDLLTLVKDGNLNSSLPDAPVAETPQEPEAPEEPLDPELPSNIAVLTAFAGTYSVSGTATDPVSRGSATRDHARGTIIISANGAVDFDSGISFTAADIGAIYDRRNICDFEPQFDRAACRVHVNYDADDSGRKLEIYLDLDKSTVLEIRYQDGQGGLTRAAIGAAGEEDLPDNQANEGQARLNGQYGITGLIDGVEYTYTENVQVSSLSGRILLNYYNQSTDYLWQLHLPQEPGTYACGWSTDTAHILVKAGDDFAHQVTPALGGSCTLVLTSVSGDFIEGSFEGQMYSGSQLITSGYFIHPL
jgi:hypothetical protein